ncbi:bifunctional ornithine acetyltransferase/N-acetylglutamate synthase [Bacillus sp. AFS017336]|uniref:bifunctional ornithine acetyltransferase/N-acetylglutamate synthase n=1 Tax=Bacillus sp. AFS017336 TaxID=2033489 RepID=UPI000BF18E45|nr:bifunctional ornithine acetyltransferase/N-acetylglutamate synthase [Bacillus sp. AFS017336]PEL13325.1 bifunctional ornithine acetyltransferase/N-acetylglutamate synthase [Bacillus sp. AFS017336]
MITKEKNIKKINGTITSPNGFYASGVHAGLRYKRKDLGLIYSEKPASVAAVYTLNLFPAAPISVTKKSITNSNKLQAVLVNSGCANACTGKKGEDDAYLMRAWCAEHLNLPEHLVAIASTGVIGEYLKMDRLKSGIDQLTLGSTLGDGEDFGHAILTTDTVIKTTCYEVMIDGKVVTIAGAAKGSGMIHPNMATMLGFVTTDATINSVQLQDLLKEVTDKTFNQITVDGDTSTNDMVLVMANGAVEHEELTKSHPDWANFAIAFQLVCEDLAKKIARDGEGATKLIEVNVNGATNKKDANKIAKTIVGSNLVKTAVYGEDANWGRIIGAIGYSGIEGEFNQIDISINGVTVLFGSKPVEFDEEEAKAALKNEIVYIDVHLHSGDAVGTAWGCDLTYDYVKINASYRS